MLATSPASMQTTIRPLATVAHRLLTLARMDGRVVEKVCSRSRWRSERDDLSSLSIGIASTMYPYAIRCVSRCGYGPDGSGVARYLIRCYGCVREGSEEPRDRPGCALNVESWACECL